jgi:photosystem II stability/assembly factor-like uncharacterized protein
VWKSTDAAVTMEYAWDDSFPQGMGAITMGSDGRLWAGSGETQPGGGSITFPGDGVYVSSDRGASWRNVGLRNSKTIGEIAVDPTNPDRIFVAASGSLYTPGGERGIYLSETGGANWKLVLAPETPFTGGVDLAIDPTNPDRIFAAMWDHQREPAVRTYGGLGSGLYRSLDGGQTWTRLDNVLTYSAGDSVNGEPLGLNQSIYLGRIGVALAPNNPDKVYVITTKTDGSDGGFYISTDGGESFNASGPNANNRPGSQGGFGWWFGRIWVDPLDENHVLVAGVSMRRSTNGGVNWANVGGLHADQHAMQWATAIPNRVYVGNDGGTYRSNNNGASGFVQAIDEPYTQFYTIDVSETDPQRVVGGAQDNGSNRSWNSAGVVAPGGTGWTSHGGGDGESNVIDYNDQLRMYYCSQYGSCTRSSNGGNSGSGFGSRAGTRNNWTAPVVLDPNDPSIIYYGSNVLSRSTNYAQNFTRLSPPEIDLTGSFEPGQSIPNINGPYGNWGTITTISPSKTDSNLVYLGTDTGRLWKTPDLGATWIEFNNHGLPGRWVTRVEVDPTNANVVYATFSGYKAGDDAAHVYKTTDGGTTWQNISGNLPNAPVNDVIVDTANSTVYVGTDVGAFFLKNGKKNWKPVGTGMPLAPIMDLRLHSPSNTLYAATFGRGMWSVSLGQ